MPKKFNNIKDVSSGICTSYIKERLKHRGYERHGLY